MMHSRIELEALGHAAALEQPLKALEDQLVALGTALHRQDTAAIDAAAAALHVALAAAVEHFTHAARLGTLPAPLRQRLALASGQVAAQREALARATASLDRAIDVLLPRQAQAGVYGASGYGGLADRRSGGALLA